MSTTNRRLAILAILATLAGIGSCTMIFNPGKYGMTPADMEAPLPD